MGQQIYQIPAKWGFCLGPQGMYKPAPLNNMLLEDNMLCAT